MLRVRKDAGVTLGFTALAFAVAFWQMPGRATSDTKIDLYVDPGHGSWPAWPRRGPTRRTWARSTAPSTAATCGRWGRSSPSATRSASRRGSPSGCGWGSSWPWRRGECCGCSTCSSARPAGSPTSSPPRSTRSTPTRSCSPHAPAITLLGYAALPWLMLAVHRGLRAEAPGAGRAAVLVVAGGVRAHLHLGRRRGQRGARRLRPAGAGRVARLRAGHGSRPVAGRARPSSSRRRCSACSFRCGG